LADGISEDAPGLFGWVPKPPRGQGRPEFEWSHEKSNRIMVLFACGYTHAEVAAVIGCDAKTLRKVFSRECREKGRADLVMRSGMMMQLVSEAEKGSVTAIKQLEAMVEREQTRVLGEKVKARGKPDKAEPKAAPLGKKQQQQLQAEGVGGLYSPRPGPHAVN